ncbi:MAG: hypothetical protein EBZ88_08180, partial [Actinobacteria bacterium]|nr:hypothetical protein [Actinomycetota bacterium]
AKFQDRGKIGQALSALSRELGIDKRLRPDDRFGSIGTYHPFVCRVFCERHGYPLHPVLKQALDPR